MQETQMTSPRQPSRDFRLFQSSVIHRPTNESLFPTLHPRSSARTDTLPHCPVFPPASKAPQAGGAQGWFAFGPLQGSA